MTIDEKFRSSVYDRSKRRAYVELAKL